jgi:hypothetical protein
MSNLVFELSLDVLSLSDVISIFIRRQVVKFSTSRQIRRPTTIAAKLLFKMRSYARDGHNTGFDGFTQF